MNRNELHFERPADLQATQPAELRGLQRDEVRLLVSNPDGHHHSYFHQLADFLQAGDLLVVNNSATLPASLPARAAISPTNQFLLNFSTAYGNGLWLAEPRWNTGKPGPLPLSTGEIIRVLDRQVCMVSPFPGLPRLWYVEAPLDLPELMVRSGQPIRYGYVNESYDLTLYQTIFARIPGSAEMPSAARPFTPRVLDSLRQKGIEITEITLHTGVSSHEVETETVELQPLYAEPFHVPIETAHAVNQAKAQGRRVIAVGTTVVRALESAWNGRKLCPARGFTRLYVHPTHGIHTVDGLISGFHDPFASHLAMLYAVAGQELIRTGYEQAVEHGYLWHEFGDSHLILTK